MTLNQILYFQKVARLENYHQAAEELYISQPSLSRSMAVLESELGVALFEKKGRGVTLTTMNGSFNAIAQNLNVQRLYEKAFDQVLISPTPLWQFIAGQIIGGSLRGFYAGGVILVLTMPIDTGLIFNGWSFLVMFLNGAVFSAIGVVVSFLAKNHADVPRFSNYIIMPMAYLCNTFFSTEKLPGFLGKFVSALPLSQTSHMIRSISAGEGFAMSGIAILMTYLIVFTAIASWFIYKKKNL